MHKYRVADKSRRTDVNGTVFASLAEMEYAAQLDLDPDIAYVFRQVPVQLGPDHRTVVDFLVATNPIPAGDRKIEAHEVKGMVKPADRKTWKLWAKYAPIPLRVVMKSGKGFKTVEVIDGRTA